jgi:hypothetical protein
VNNALEGPQCDYYQRAIVFRYDFGYSDTILGHAVHVTAKVPKNLLHSAPPLLRRYSGGHVLHEDELAPLREYLPADVAYEDTFD